MKRRNFLKSLSVAGAVLLVAPRLMADSKHALYADLKHDDSAALQAWIDGKPVYWKDGSRVDPKLIQGKSFRIDHALTMGGTPDMSINGCHFDGSLVPLTLRGW